MYELNLRCGEVSGKLILLLVTSVHISNMV